MGDLADGPSVQAGGGRGLISQGVSYVTHPNIQGFFGLPCCDGAAWGCVRSAHPSTPTVATFHLDIEVFLKKRDISPPNLSCWWPLFSFPSTEGCARNCHMSYFVFFRFIFFAIAQATGWVNRAVTCHTRGDWARGGPYLADLFNPM